MFSFFEKYLLFLKLVETEISEHSSLIMNNMSKNSSEARKFKRFWTIFISPNFFIYWEFLNIFETGKSEIFFDNVE
jgi:hypothetical protein